MHEYPHDPRFDPPEEQFEREREKSRARRARLLASLLMLATGLVMDALGELHGRGRFTFFAAGLAAAVALLGYVVERAKADEEGPYSARPDSTR